jgi:4-hydroxybenzoate polyprenyltransferase
MPTYDKNKNERIAIFVDCILGIISGMIGMIGILFFALPNWNSPFFIVSFSFWIFWIILCVIFIILGISTHYANKNYDPDKQPRRDLKAPIVS